MPKGHVATVRHRVLFTFAHIIRVRPPVTHARVALRRRLGLSRKSEKPLDEIGKPHQVLHRLMGEDSSFRATLTGKKYGLH
jgi:hypothetical protein